MPTSTFDVKIEGLKELTKVFNEAPEKVGPIYKEALKRSSAILDSNRLNPGNIPWITGELARRWTTDFTGLILKTKPDVDYAKAVQFGMPPSPGRYVPAIKRRLKNGPVSRIGMWPGFKGRHFMEKIRSASVNDINNTFKEALKLAVQAIIKK